MSTKTCNIVEMVRDRAKVAMTDTKSHRRFRLVPKSMTSDDLEWPKRHSCRNKVLRSPSEIFE